MRLRPSGGTRVTTKVADKVRLSETAFARQVLPPKWPWCARTTNPPATCVTPWLALNFLLREMVLLCNLEQRTRGWQRPWLFPVVA